MTKSGQKCATTNFDWTSIDPNIIDLCTRQDTIYRFNFLICLVWPGQSNTAEWKLTSLSTSLQVSIFNTVPKDFVLVIVHIIWCRQGGEARDEHAQCGRHQQRGQGGSCQDIRCTSKPGLILHIGITIITFLLKVVNMRLTDGQEREVVICCDVKVLR